MQRQNDKINIIRHPIFTNGQIRKHLYNNRFYVKYGCGMARFGSANVDTFRRFHITTTGTTPPPPPSLPTTAGRDGGVSVEQLPV